jgi:hypothetical protein
VTAAGSLEGTCSTDLTVTSPGGDYQCFENTGSSERNDNTYITDEHLNKDSENGNCDVALTVTCSASGSISYTDNRYCDTSTNAAACALAGAIAEDVTINGLSLSLTYESVIVEGVRLHNTRHYPKGHSAASADFTTTDFGDVTNRFTCDAPTCPNDPYLVLAKNSDGKFGHACKFNGQASKILSGATTAAGDSGSAVCSDDANGNAGSISNTAIKLPGKVFPQFYVYGITSFSSSTTSTVDANPTSRRLGARLGAPATQDEIETKTVFTLAPSHVIKH